MQKYLEGFESLDTPIVVVKDKKLIQANKAFIDFLGVIDEEKILNQSLHMIVHESDVPRVLRLMQEGMHTLSSLSVRAKTIQNGKVVEKIVELWVALLGGDFAGQWALSIRKKTETRRVSEDSISRIRNLYLHVGGQAFLSERAFVEASRSLFSDLKWGVGLCEVKPEGTIMKHFLVPSGIGGAAWDFGKQIVGKLVPFSQIPRFLDVVHQKKEITIVDMPVGIGWIRRWSGGSLAQMAEVAENLNEGGFHCGYGVPVFVRDRVKQFVVVAANQLSEKDMLAIQFFASQLGSVLLIEEILKESARQDRMAVLGQMSSIVAHEIRNPLAVILQSKTQALQAFAKEKPDLDTVQQLCGIIGEEIHSLEQLVNNLLNFSQPLSPQRQQVSLKELIGLVLAGKRENFCLNHVHINIPKDLPDIMADPLLLRQSFEQLLTNALMQEHIREGSIYIDAIVLDEENVALSIQNEHGAISEENFHKIFDPFFTTKATGSGLGLPVAKRLVEEQGGTLIAKQQNGAISFVITVPVFNGGVVKKRF